MKTEDLIAAVDIGGTNTKACVWEIGTPFDRPVDTWTTDRSYEGTLSNIQNWLSRYPKVKTLGLSIGGSVDTENGVVVASNKFPDFVGRPFADDLATMTSGRARIAHDCVAALAGLTDLNQPHKRTAYITFSTGLGAAFSTHVAGRPLLHRIRVAHQTIDPSGPKCNCGRNGCATTFLDADYQMRINNMKLSEYRDSEFWERYTNVAEIVIANAAHMLVLGKIFIGGGVLSARPDIASILISRLGEIKIGGEYGSCAVEFLQNSNIAPLKGAAIMASNPHSFWFST